MMRLTCNNEKTAWSDWMEAVRDGRSGGGNARQRRKRRRAMARSSMRVVWFWRVPA